MTRTNERSAAQLLTEFGAAPARKPQQPQHRPTSRDRINRPRAPRRGRAQPGQGWAPVEAPLTVYQAATHEIGGLFPLLAANGTPAVGARIGYDTVSGSAFYCRSMATNPSMVVFGEPGRGKSSTVVAFLLRMMLFGTKTLISGDVKGG